MGCPVQWPLTLCSKLVPAAASAGAQARHLGSGAQHPACQQPPHPWQSPDDQTLQTFQMSSGQQTRPPPTPGEAASILTFSSFLPWSGFCSVLQVPLLSARTGYPQGTCRHPCAEGSAEPGSPLTVSCARLVAALLPVPLATAGLGARPARLCTRSPARAPLAPFQGMGPSP